MITVSVKEENYRYNAYHLTKEFLPDEETESILDCGQESAIVVLKDGTEIANVAAGLKLQYERELYRQLAAFAGKQLPWGILTGVRPTKLASAALNRGATREEFIAEIGETRLVSAEKAGLSRDIAERESRIIKDALGGKTSDPESYSLYIGIPICPSICSYCSFSSGPLSVWGKRLDEYVDALCSELKQKGKMLEGKAPTSVYIGGGTPTVLNEIQLARLIACINENFEVLPGAEFTLEAGRPDTITEEKLAVAAAGGVNRVSINPQTMQQKTLDRVGRKHSAGQVAEALGIARKVGFANINMDIIAGLPGEDAADMQDTLEKIAAMEPDSLTVHSLAIKRAAKMTQQECSPDVVERQIRLAAEAAEGMGLLPYYLYRQKSIAGNFENVGYARPGKFGVYNVMIMEEVQSIVGCGAGAASKRLLAEPVKDAATGKLTRLLHSANVKGIAEYIAAMKE